MRASFLAILLAAVFACASAWASAPLRVAVEASYRPFSFLDSTGGLTGFDVDIANALCEQMQRKCVITPMPFEEIIASIVEGKTDMAVASLGITREREKLVAFSDRYFRSHSIFIEKPGAVVGISCEDLKGKRIGVQEGTLQQRHLEACCGEDITLVLEPDFYAVLASLKKDQADLALVDGLAGYEYLRSEQGVGLETIGEPVYSEIMVDSSHIALPKNNPKLLKAVNDALKMIIRNGVYGKINRKYFDYPVH